MHWGWNISLTRRSLHGVYAITAIKFSKIELEMMKKKQFPGVLTVARNYFNESVLNLRLLVYICVSMCVSMRVLQRPHGCQRTTCRSHFLLPACGFWILAQGLSVLGAGILPCLTTSPVHYPRKNFFVSLHLKSYSACAEELSTSHVLTRKGIYTHYIPRNCVKKSQDHAWWNVQNVWCFCLWIVSVIGFLTYFIHIESATWTFFRYTCIWNIT